MTIHQHEDQKPLDPLRRELAGQKGKAYWRSLNELANSEEFEKLVRQEFPRQASVLGILSRRDFLKIVGASLALAGLAACAPQNPEKILPYVKPPEQLIPGKSNYFASAMVQDGFAKGVLIETSMGRPIKVEGNPNHPDSLGATDIFMQASILELYDPDRVKQVTSQGTAKTWEDFTTFLGGVTGSLGQGAGLRILSGPVTSPTLISQLTALLSQYPQARWYQHDPAGQASAHTAVYDFSKADVILSLDSDFLFGEPGHLRYSRDFALRHQPISASGTMNRLYVVEGSLTLTGSNADHRLGVKPSQVEAFARAVASRLGVSVTAPTGDVPGQNWLDPLVADLKRAGANALVIAGQRQPPIVHALAQAMNQALGSVGVTVNLLSAPAPAAAISSGDLGELVNDLNNNQVTTLVILEGNPAYSTPVDLNFAEAMKKAAQSIYLAYFPDETAALATWVIPAAHSMESWGDARAFDGTASIVQPVIEPLYGGKSPVELVAALAGQPAASGYDLVRAFWQSQMTGGSFERDWREALGRGVVANSAPQIPLVTTAPDLSATPSSPAQGLEITFQPDDTVWDGRFTNNSWLQELPKQLSKLAWDNAAYFSPTTADRLGLADGDVVTLKLRGHSIDAPVFKLPGQPDDVVAVTLGYGRTAGGSLVTNSGYNAYALRTSQAPWFDSGLEVSKTGRKYDLALTQDHWNMENRGLVRSATLEEYQAHPEFAHEGEEGMENPASLYGEAFGQSAQYAWGMSINLNTCIGCNACVVACQAENNIPTVGKSEVLNSREMHWLRIDRYYQGSAENPAVFFQPVPCMHCETAPCEPVCPVEATSHSAEGINEMTYNRCVGTKYCSNNCPYKVRRFNFYKYMDENVASLRAMRNPDVTVRSRGVMEKCNYCVQRVNQARIQAQVEGRAIQDGEVKTACQQACPTQAIVFGNIKDSGSEVRKQKDTPLNYGLLAELGTKPRTTYLAKVKNTNPLIKEEA